MITVTGKEIVGLGGRVGSVSDRFGPVAATKLQPVALQSEDQKAQTSPNIPRIQHLEVTQIRYCRATFLSVELRPSVPAYPQKRHFNFGLDPRRTTSTT